ncbi:MFS transporter [Streptomyces sp. NPDC056309]|uniref:MFS transporter n=1 Tax=unclassified Streptomyces TaxID=2593676 RepID=UPI0035DCCEA6
MSGDRADKRRLLMGTRTALAVLVLFLGLLSVTHVVRLGMVVLLAIALCTVKAIDNPTRRTLVPEVVGPHFLRDAVSLNSVTTNAARRRGGSSTRTARRYPWISGSPSEWTTPTRANDREIHCPIGSGRRS